MRSLVARCSTFRLPYICRIYIILHFLLYFLCWIIWKYRNHQRIWGWQEKTGKWTFTSNPDKMESSGHAGQIHLTLFLLVCGILERLLATKYLTRKLISKTSKVQAGNLSVYLSLVSIMPYIQLVAVAKSFQPNQVVHVAHFFSYGSSLTNGG